MGVGGEGKGGGEGGRGRGEGKGAVPQSNFSVRISSENLRIWV